MFCRKCVAVAVSVCFLAAPLGCGEPDEAPGLEAFLATTFEGAGLGASAGLFAGWVRYADRNEMQDVWESVGYGALAGLGLGVGAAVLGGDGTGDLVLKDINTVSAAGGGVGTLWGVVSALFTGDSRRIANGLAWGSLSGFALGMAAAGYKLAAHRYACPGAEGEKDNSLLRVEVFEGPSPSGTPMLTFRRRF